MNVFFFSLYFCEYREEIETQRERERERERGLATWTFCILREEFDHGSSQKRKRETVSTPFFDAWRASL